MSEELQRLDHNKLGERPHGLWMTLIVDLGDHPDQTSHRIIEVARLLAGYGTYWGSKTGSRWPNNQEWRRLLPQWLLASFKDYSKEECEKMMAEMPRERWHELPWLFDSWTASMKDRTWEWWSSKRHDRVLKVRLLVEGWPYSIGALEYLLKSAGATSIQRIEGN